MINNPIVSAKDDKSGPALIAGSIPILVRKIGITDPANVAKMMPKKIEIPKIKLIAPMFVTSVMIKNSKVEIMIADAIPLSKPIIASFLIALKVFAWISSLPISARIVTVTVCNPAVPQIAARIGFKVAKIRCLPKTSRNMYVT